MYYLCSENKGADQLSGYWETDLCLCKSRFSHDDAHMAVTKTGSRASVFSSPEPKAHR